MVKNKQGTLSAVESALDSASVKSIIIWINANREAEVTVKLEDTVFKPACDYVNVDEAF